jgi:hypothetical protein
MYIAMRALSITFLIILATYYACNPPIVQYETVPPRFQIDSGATVVIIDNASIQSNGIMGNKKRDAVLQEIKRMYIDSLVQQCAQTLHVKPILDSGFITTTSAVISINSRGNVLSAEQVQQFLQKHRANYALVLQAYNGGFDQEQVQRERNNDGSVSKTASYAIHFGTVVSFYHQQQSIIASEYVEARKFHSNRAVLSGLLAAGPSYEKNKEQIMAMALTQQEQLLNLFRTHQRVKQRPLLR